MSQQEVKKMKQGMSYSCKEKTIILNVFKYFRLENPDKCITELVRRTSKATGCSEKSIFQFRKEEASVEGFKVPSTTKIRRNININSRDIKYDSTVRQAIRNIIYDLKYKNIVPSLNTILKQVNSDTQIPKFSLMTLRRLMRDMGFCYEKNGSKSVLIEKIVSVNIKKEITTPVKKNKKKKDKKMNDDNINNCSNYPVDIKNSPQLMQINNQNMIPNGGVQNFSEHKLMSHLHMQHDVIPPPSHPHPSVPVPRNVSMMFTHAMPPPAPHLPVHHNMDVHLKRDISPWMHHSPHHLMKQQ